MKGLGSPKSKSSGRARKIIDVPRPSSVARAPSSRRLPLLAAADARPLAPAVGFRRGGIAAAGAPPTDACLAAHRSPDLASCLQPTARQGREAAAALRTAPPNGGRLRA